MRDFADRARRALRESGYSMSAAARALNYDLAYLSRVLNRKQAPSENLAKALDELVGANGELASQVVVNTLIPEAKSLQSETAPSTDVDYMRATINYVVNHDNRFGGDVVAPVAVQAWKAAHNKLMSGAIPDRLQCEYIGTLAEVVEVAGWLLFDAGEDERARTAFLESHMLARQAGDHAMEWFTMDLMAMQFVHNGHSRESLRIADELTSLPRIPPRVALAASMRRMRALGQVCDRAGMVSARETMWSGFEKSLSPRDPSWAWWLNEEQLLIQEGEALLSLGDFGAAESVIQRAIELCSASFPQGRGVLYNKVSLFLTYSSAKAWRDCESLLIEIMPLLETVTSGRIRRRLRASLLEMIRAQDTPTWLSELAREVQADMA